MRCADRPATIGLLGLAGMVLLGCGGGAGETGSCGVEPCGGSLVGSWVFTNRCGTTTQTLATCAVVDLSALDMSGESSGGCTCTFHYSPQPSTESGTYATNGTALTLTKVGGTPSSSEYCVRGSWLTISAVNRAGDTGQNVWRKN